MKKLDMKVKFVEFVESIPRCTDEETWKRWKELARTVPPNPVVGFCEDCTLDYQIEMKAHKRCENPHVMFKADEDGFISGRLPEVVE